MIHISHFRLHLLTANGQNDGHWGILLLKVGDCSIVNLQADDNKAKEHPGSAYPFSLELQFANTCGLATDLIELIQVNKLTDEIHCIYSSEEFQKVLEYCLSLNLYNVCILILYS